MLTNENVVNLQLDLSRMKRLRQYLLIATIGEFCLYCLWYGKLGYQTFLICRMYSYFGISLWNSQTVSLLMSTLTPILYIISFIRLLYSPKASSPAKKWIGTLIILNLASCPAISVVHLIEIAVGSYTLPHYIGLTCLYFLNLNLLSVIPIIMVSKYGMSQLSRVMWIIITVISLSPINFFTYLIMKNMFSTDITPTKNDRFPIIRSVGIFVLHLFSFILFWTCRFGIYTKKRFSYETDNKTKTITDIINNLYIEDSNEAALLNIFLILLYVSAAALLLFLLIGKSKKLLHICSLATSGSLAFITIIAATMEPYEHESSFMEYDALWGDTYVTYTYIYEFSSSCLILTTVAIAVGLLSFWIIRSAPPLVAKGKNANTVHSSPVAVSVSETATICEPASVRISNHTPEERLTQLNDLKARGLITEEEYNEKKQSILSEL